MAEIRLRHHQISIHFDELQQTGKLPTLKIALASLEGGKGKSPRPFEEGKQVVWAQAPASNYYVQVDKNNLQVGSTKPRLMLGNIKSNRY